MGLLTDLQLRRWVKAEQPISGKADGGGLTFTLSTAGRASWILRYRFGGRGREVTIGNYPDIGLADARMRASELRAQIQRGIDVAAEKRKSKLAHRNASTVAELCQQYMDLKAVELKQTTKDEVARYLAKDIIPRIGHIPTSELAAPDVIYLIEQIAKRSKSVARRTFEMVSVILGFGVSRHAVARNVCVDLKVSSIIGQTKPRRKRIQLSEDELRAILPQLHKLGVENALAFKILLTTCVRKSELFKAKWEHISGRFWEIPAENAKNGKSFVIPLPPTALSWFKELKALAGNSSYVLPARWRRNGAKSPHMSRSTLNAALDRINLSIRRFTPHDLRSTARSYLTGMGVSITVAERCLNHELGGLVGVYDVNDYMDERARALEIWADFLHRCEHGNTPRSSKVVQLRG